VSEGRASGLEAAPNEPERMVSVVIPCRNGAATLGPCLRAALASRHPRFEVVVVDDASEDGSAAIARSFPCKLVQLDGHRGVSAARNAGAAASAGTLLFFTDADCLLQEEALSIASAAYGQRGDLVLGGSYTPLPHDGDFFSAFQSVAIHHAETRRRVPDYVATHAMVIDAALFRRSGGFLHNDHLGVAPGVEDVELSHRLRQAGCLLAMEPRVRVKHIFRFSLRRSLANAAHKARRWTRYSLAHRDLLTDSGAASHGLKLNVLLALLQVLLAALAVARGSAWPLAAAPLLLALDLGANGRLLAAWRAAKGLGFCARAALYFTTLYALAVGIGAAAGAAAHLWNSLSNRAVREARA